MSCQLKSKKEDLFDYTFLYVGEHGGTEFPVIIEQTCLTVLGMDTGSTKVALPFSVTEFYLKSVSNDSRVLGLESVAFPKWPSHWTPFVSHHLLCPLEFLPSRLETIIIYRICSLFHIHWMKPNRWYPDITVRFIVDWSVQFIALGPVSRWLVLHFG